jgi:hypothetical protein
MGGFADQLMAGALVLAALFIGPGTAIAFMLLRRRRLKAARRSPLGINVLRGPGHTLREQLDEETSNVVWDLLALSALPLMMLALYLSQLQMPIAGQLRYTAHMYMVITIGIVAYLTHKLVKRGARLANLRTGYDAEVAVGQELDALQRRSAVVYHDFPCEGFNIEHVVITPTTIYAVETKGYTKLNTLTGRDGATVEFDGMTLKLPTWTSDAPIQQAERQAKWLADWVRKATGHTVPMRPVVALPGWFVKERGFGSVKVYSGRQLSTLLDGPLPQLDPRTQSVTHQVEQRCRTVVPTYKRDGTEKST